MGRLSYEIARFIWALLLWIIRRPTIKRIRQQLPNRLPGPMREGASDSMLRQDKFARKYGIRILQFTVSVVGLMIVFSLVSNLVLFAVDQGWLSVPSNADQSPT